MDLKVLLAIAAFQVVVLVVPGPDILLVSQTAMARSRRAALFAGLGVVLGISCWAGLALLGINILFQNFPLLHGIIKFLGGAYLLWMGYNLWKSSLSKQTDEVTAKDQSLSPLSDLKALRMGFLTNIANPKAAIFFGSMFSGVMSVDASLGLKLSAFALIIGLSLIWFALVALGMSTNRVQNAYLRAKKTIDRAAGTFMLGFGGLLLASKE